jgi:hypothetical protein
VDIFGDTWQLVAKCLLLEVMFAFIWKFIGSKNKLMAMNAVMTLFILAAMCFVLVLTLRLVLTGIAAGWDYYSLRRSEI